MCILLCFLLNCEYVTIAASSTTLVYKEVLYFLFAVSLRKLHRRLSYYDANCLIITVRSQNGTDMKFFQL